ncbi:heterokaryon incompatibility protein-domain-containing protein [Trichoderma sp. SZMC 28011]
MNRHNMAGLETYPELPDSRSIRVIKLHGATGPNDDIRFDLITVSLDAPLPYEAISYTWSGQPLDRPVYANGREYLVTRNAEDVMRRLRPNKPEHSRHLWIDAICINQKDDKEKAVEVQLMYEIYANAERVNIWLGQGSESTALALKWLRWYSWTFSPVRRAQAKCAGAITSAGSIFIRLLLGIAVICMSCVWACIMLLVGAVVLFPFGLLPIFKSYKKRFRDGLAELASMEYWERAWTVQEANANELCFILCGSSAPLRLDLFYMSHYMIPPIYIFSTLNNSKLNQRYSLHILDIFHTHGQAEFGAQIFDVLCKTKATIAKDKLFAIRAMFPDSLGALTIDYSVSDSDIYTEAARIVLEETQNVEFFRYACQPGREDRFPSWVPSWSALIDIPDWICKFAPTTISQEAVIIEDDDMNVLKLKGLRIEKVASAISERFPSVPPLQVPWSRSLDLNVAHEAFVVFREWVHSTGAVDNQDPCMLQLAWMISQMINLDVNDVLAWFQLTWSEDNFGMEKLWDYGLHGGEVCDSRKFTVNFLQMVSGRSLFMTETGRVGMSTFVIRPGDEIALLTGEKLPYVIRKNLDCPDKYSLVAPSWLSGALMGEEWPGWNGQLEDLEDIELV